MSTWYLVLLIVNLFGLALGVSNMRMARLLGQPQTGNVVAFGLCVFGTIWSAANLY